MFNIISDVSGAILEDFIVWFGAFFSGHFCQNWKIYFSLKRPQIQKLWKRVLTNDELLDICHFEQNFQWANVQEIMGEIWPHRFGLVGSGQPTDLLFWLWTLQPICIELVIWCLWLKLLRPPTPLPPSIDLVYLNWPYIILIWILPWSIICVYLAF